MIAETQNQYFYIVSYFLDGRFIKWEEVIGETRFALDVADEMTLFVPDQDGSVKEKVVSTEALSDDEYRVFLVS